MAVKKRFVRKDALQAELRETLERYQTIFRATHDILYDLNFHTSKVYWNEALYTQFGYDTAEPSETLEWWTSHIHPDDALGVEHHITDLLESQENNWNHEYRFRKSDGSYVDVRDRGFIIRAADGAPQRIIGSFLDISHQKQLERAKDEFSSLISHQLRTPLTVIRIYSELLADGTFGDLSASQNQEVRKIQQSSIKLIELVNDILQISSIELQPVKLEQAQVDMSQLLQDSLRAVQALADQKAIELSYKAAPGVKPLCTDARILEQVVHNLLTNAIRYSPAATGTVHIAVEPHDKGCLVTVSDNGIGIPRADQPHVFARFYRAHNAVNTEEHGTGLGLYYVQLVTKAFGGRVWFESARGKGTTFFLYVPAANQHLASAGEPASPHPPNQV